MNYMWRKRSVGLPMVVSVPVPGPGRACRAEGYSGLDFDQVLRQEFGLARQGGGSGEILSSQSLLRIGNEALDGGQRVALLLAQPLLVYPGEQSLGPLDPALNLLTQAGRLALPDLWREHGRSLGSRWRRGRRGRRGGGHRGRRGGWGGRRRGRRGRGNGGRGSRRRHGRRGRSEQTLHLGAAGQRQRENHPHPPDQRPAARHSHSLCSMGESPYRIGRNRPTDVPCPTSEVTWTSPSWRCRVRYTRESPTPLPSLFVV
jgi:hypothetical protein